MRSHMLSHNKAYSDNLKSMLSKATQMNKRSNEKKKMNTKDTEATTTTTTSVTDSEADAAVETTSDT